MLENDHVVTVYNLGDMAATVVGVKMHQVLRDAAMISQ